MSQTKKQLTGAWGEERAVAFLAKLGYTIIKRNYLVRGGEVDIIAWHDKPHFGRTLCFVEVKTREHDDGSAERATGKDKLAHLFRAGTFYCLENKIDQNKTPIQFEQVSVYGAPTDLAPAVKHFIIPI